MSQAPGIVITPMRRAEAGDVLRFFDHERGTAFADTSSTRDSACSANRRI